MMHLLKKYNEIIIRRYLLEKYNLNFLENIMVVKNLELRVIINLKVLSVLKVLDILNKVEGLTGKKGNYKLNTNNSVEITSKLSGDEIWEFWNNLYNKSYLKNFKELEMIKCGYNEKNNVVDFELKNILSEEVPIRIYVRIALNISKDCKISEDSLKEMLYCLGFYKHEI